MTAPLAIIAAVGPGMGLAIGRRFAREGFDLALIARSATQTNRLVDMLAEHGTRVRAHACDLMDAVAITATIAGIQEDQGPASVMVYNGGVWNEGPPLAMAPADFDSDLALCITGAYACAQAVHASMKARGGGTILFTGGGLALAPQYGTGVLSLVAGKSGLRGLGLALFEALKPDGIHVGMVTIAGTVAPGTAFDPDAIAESYWRLFMQPRAEWTAEIVFTGR
jgi:short-subunit dehydrogenase